MFHYRESQALFREIPVAKVADNASTSSKRIDGNYTLITKQVEVNPAQTIQEDIPAKIKTIERRVLVKDETTRKATIPAEYKEIKKKILLKKGGMSAWREVPCSIPERGEILPINYSLGSDAFNLNLSERRAKNVVEYLISKGVDDTRLIAVGYGETKLMNDCTNGKDCADNIHAQNRRTEFKVF